MKIRSWKIRETILLVGFLLFLMPTVSFSQEFPTKPINLLIAMAPAGPLDTPTRVLASKAERFLGQPFVVSNNAGGAGSVALGFVAKEKPDGYHLVGCYSTPLIRVPQFRPVPYKSEDFIPVMHYGTPESGLVIKADSPWKTLKEFVEYAKKNPGKVTYSITGTGSPLHLSMEYIAKQEGIRWTMVPFTGSNPTIPLLGGHVTASATGTQFIPYVKAGSLRLLATHGEKRMKTFPNVPTLRELGYDFINESVLMFVTPKGTPLSIVKKLDEAFHKAMDAPEFIDIMEKLEITISYRNHEDTKKYLDEAYSSLAKTIIDLKIPKEVEKK